jgi:hypothetical protein
VMVRPQGREAVARFILSAVREAAEARRDKKQHRVGETHWQGTHL